MIGSSVDEAALGSKREATAAFAGVVFWMLVAAAVFSIVGLVLAVAGVLVPILLVAIALPSAIGLGLWGWQPFKKTAGQVVHGGLMPTAVAVLVIVASAWAAAAFSAEHIQTDRDPGVYLTTGRWLADEGTLLISGTIGGFEGIDGITAESSGYFEWRDDGTLDAQFMHLLPVWAAAAHWIGGDQAMMKVNAAVVALALAALWLFAATLMRPWFAVLATAATAVILPTVHFARDLYSEPLAMVFVFGGLALLALARRARHPGLSVIAGMLVGGVTMSRIDGWLVTTAIVAYLMWDWWSARDSGESEVIFGFVRPVLLGITLSGSISLLDGMVRSRPYLVERSGPIVQRFGLLIAVTIIGLIAFRWPEPFRRLRQWVRDHRATIAWVVPVTIAAVAASFYLIRPFVQEIHAPNVDGSIEILQEYDGLDLDGTRRYYEWSMHWLAWYLGIFGLAVGLAGLVWSWRKAILGRRDLWPFVLVLSLTGALYVWRPSITPDQLWAMRRFLPVVLPGLVVMAALGSQWLIDRVPRRAIGRGVCVAALAGLVLVPLSLTWPIGNATSYVGMYGAIEDICQTAPRGSAMLLTTRFAGRYQAPVRSFCGIPTAGIIDPDEDPSCLIAEVNRAWAAEGVNLMVGYRDELAVKPDATVEATYQLPEFTLTRRPDETITRTFNMSIVDADRIDSSAC